MAKKGEWLPSWVCGFGIAADEILQGSRSAHEQTLSSEKGLARAMVVPHRPCD